jgi:flavin-dependent dehydrogenase
MPDVVVCGAGPAGSIAALVLARAGARVRIIDRARFPRDKLCGDTVNPGAMAILSRLGLRAATAGGLPIDGMLVTGDSGIRCVGRYASGARGIALRRATLDAALLDAAVRAGAVFEERVLVRDPIVDSGRVRGVVVAGPNGMSRTLASAMVIAADGGSSRLARALGLSRHAARPRRWAVGAYFEDVSGFADGARLGEMHVRPGRYVGVAPMPGGITNACVVTSDRRALRNPGALLRETLDHDALLADRFSGARMVTRPVCLGPLAVQEAGCGVPGLLLAGDAAGFIDPMTGDGLRFAFRGAELAAETALSAMDRGSLDAPATLSRLRRQEFGAKWRFNRTLRAVAESPIAVRVAAVGARWSPSLLARVIRYAGDEAR